jgi:hypothetical protein
VARNPAAGFRGHPATACPCRTLRTPLWFVSRGCVHPMVRKTAGCNAGDMRKADLIRCRIRLHIGQQAAPAVPARRQALAR